MKLAPVAIATPPVEAAYHCGVPVVQVAPKVTVPVPQIADGITVGAFGADSTAFFTVFDSPPI